MEVNVVDLKEKLSLINELHQYKLVARMNDIEFKLIKMKREFIWHKHPDTDEVFFALEGSFDIHLRDRILTLTEGDMVVIPKNVEHKPVSYEQSSILLIEPAGTVNTGDAGGALTDTVIQEV